MINGIIDFLFSLWSKWASLFAGYPQGDPYIAFVALFSLICIAAALVPKLRLRLDIWRGRDLPDDRWERLARVMNIR